MNMDSKTKDIIEWISILAPLVLLVFITLSSAFCEIQEEVEGCFHLARPISGIILMLGITLIVEKLRRKKKK